jgi:hypothetical protein
MKRRRCLMKVMEALTRVVVGMSRFGDHLLSRKVSGTVVAALAFACGAGLARALKEAPRPTRAAVVAAKPADPARAEVSIRATSTEEAGEGAVFEGPYENYTYGYSVRIPADMVGLGPTPPAPQHGFGIDLDRPRSIAWMSQPGFPKSYVYVDGSYNSLEWTSLADAVDSHLSFLREKGRDVRVQLKDQTRLGGLPARRTVALYAEGGVEMVSDEIIAFRRDADGEASVVYTISLSTPRSRYERDRPVLKALRDGWCLQPVE